MKKTIIEIENKNYNLYVAVDAIYGEFILETEGDPTCLNELEDSDCSDLIDAINSIINDPATPWEVCNKDDEQYISECLNIWGIA
ncbi:MAG: hypothetical protein SPJ81_06380 [Lachnoclostridium sp.]|nr:hypothetical protein [Lachnoclostridium sp.]